MVLRHSRQPPFYFFMLTNFIFMFWVTDPRILDVSEFKCMALMVCHWTELVACMVRSLRLG